ncbi:uncharacterized protein BP01DRAFT_356961 [Aspergillus saccharolyticus JOP 1030-1]|uniref:Uncharacterized protein n=1 Tax=Aspergillus saccharolyticus JOP 1030-1 TaxID=1450539 RepID=A0A318ZCB4_9EURO|nr:hypothetical protein BP01DRAFT_356961 [Aspergillus saccharolyticus JOP 1030-1]PYH45045.1 hypothetical protein BP01DRAFT_356961 [Aspergillus saccharolyticus JOP 1030-1]
MIIAYAAEVGLALVGSLDSHAPKPSSLFFFFSSLALISPIMLLRVLAFAYIASYAGNAAGAVIPL